MNFLLALIIICALSAALRNPIKKCPWVFYGIAFLLDLALVVQSSLNLPMEGTVALTYAMTRGNLGVAMFVVVMFIGVLPRTGKISKWFRPIRAELSIIACILIAGHMCVYLGSYIPRFFAGKIVQSNVLIALVIALLLTILIIALGVTSLRVIKKHMKARAWKKLQTSAYAFYLLIFIHLMLMLGPAALRGNETAVISVAVYCVVFISYLVLRIIRAQADKKEKIDLAETVIDQGFEEID